MAEPIAVIGLDAKLPCDGDSVKNFFDFLVAGRSARKPVPKDRYNADAFWHLDNHRDGVVRYPDYQALIYRESTLTDTDLLLSRSVARKPISWKATSRRSTPLSSP